MGRRLNPKEKKRKKTETIISEAEKLKQKYSFIQDDPPAMPSYRGKQSAKARKQALRNRHGDGRKRQKELRAWVKEHSAVLDAHLTNAPPPRGASRAWNVSPEHPCRKAFRRCSIGNIHTLYHGTGSVEDILRNFLDPTQSRRNCMFGQGIYMGSRSKAMNYMKGAGEYGYMLVVQARLGRIYNAERPMNGATLSMLNFLAENGADSIRGRRGATASWGGTLNYDEYVVYRPEQVEVIQVLEIPRPA